MYDPKTNILTLIDFGLACRTFVGAGEEYALAIRAVAAPSEPAGRGQHQEERDPRQQPDTTHYLPASTISRRAVSVDLAQAAGPHVVDEAVHPDLVGDEG